MSRLHGLWLRILIADRRLGLRFYNRSATVTVIGSRIGEFRATLGAEVVAISFIHILILFAVTFVFLILVDLIIWAFTCSTQNLGSSSILIEGDYAHWINVLHQDVYRSDISRVTLTLATPNANLRSQRHL